jgi:hypothetical protein
MNMLEKREMKTVVLPPVQPGEPMMQMSLNGRVISFPARWARQMLFLFIPEWLRDSTVDPPEPDPQAIKQGMNKGLLEFVRSGFKNLVRLKLGTFMRGIYGPDPARWPTGVAMPKGREDILPVIDRMLIDFLVTQAFYHPLVVEYDENTGLLTSIRPGQRLAPTLDAGNTAGAASADRDGSEARGAN